MTSKLLPLSWLRFRTLRNSIFPITRETIIRTGIFLPIGLAFTVGLYIGMVRILNYLLSVEIIGSLLIQHLLSIVLFTFFFMLLFSNLATSLATLYLADDLPILFSLPISRNNIFIHKAIEATVHSSWATLLTSIPIFAAYGITHRSPFLFYFLLPLPILFFLIIPSCLGMFLVIFMAHILPAQKARQIILFGGAFLLSLLVIYFRIMQPELLVDPENFPLLAQYVTHLRTPTSPYLPSHWLSQAIMALINKDSSKLAFPLLLLFSTSAALLTILHWLSEKIYFRGWERSQESSYRKKTPSSSLQKLPGIQFYRHLPRSLRPLALKDTLIFWRDPGIWSQAIILISLIVIYLFNIRNLPIANQILKNEISFLNTAFASFVLAAIAVRFIYPAISLEGKNLWLIQSAPLTGRQIIYEKLLITLIPLILTSLVLVISSNRILHVERFIAVVSTLTIVLISTGLTCLGIGLGALYPRFEFNNPAQIATGFGGMLYMFLSMIYVGLVMSLEAWPVYLHFQGIPTLRILLNPYTQLCFVLLILLNILTIILPIRLGIRKLENIEV